MDMREIKTLLKFQNFELNDDPPKIRRVRKARSLPSWSLPNWSNLKRQTGDVTVSESMGKGPVVDLGGGDTLRVLKKAVELPSSESLPSDFSASTTSHLSSSVMSIADDYSHKASLKSFSEGRQLYDKPTYASCFIKRDKKFRTIMNILREGRPTMSEPQFTRSWRKQEEEKEKEKEERQLNDKKEVTRDNTVVLSNASATYRSKSVGNTYPNDSYTTEEDVNYEEETSEESEEEINDDVERDEEVDPYEKAKELVKKITGKIPDSEEEYESDEDEDNEEFAVFHYRPTRFEYKGSPRRRPPRETYVTNKHLTIEKTKEAKFAEVAAMRANESLRRARSLFREISPLRRMSGNTTLTG